MKDDKNSHWLKQDTNCLHWWCEAKWIIKEQCALHIESLSQMLLAWKQKDQVIPMQQALKTVIHF